MTCFPRQILCCMLMRYIDQAQLWKTAGRFIDGTVWPVSRPGENQRVINFVKDIKEYIP